ncbi:MAG: family 43 glycosylhydrolase [Firmicutes bacterium]|nr:family 43 glycosylhydrolase [Bacillota bacterium]
MEFRERCDLYLHILCYTRKPLEEQIYDVKLAYSMHLAFSTDGTNFQDLNHNSGVLFAKATENSDGTLNAKSLRNPYLFYLADGTYGVAAVRTEPDGEPDEQSKGHILLFSSSDLLQYREVGLLDLKHDTFVSDVICSYDSERQVYVIHWCDADGNYYCNSITDIFELDSAALPDKAEPFALDLVQANIEGIAARNVIEVPEEVGQRLVKKLTVPNNIKIEVPESVKASSFEELKDVKATAIYSDGTKAFKNVKWDLSGIDWNTPGTYRISGVAYQEHFKFPIAVNRADPCITKWKGKYYFIATNDADGNRTLYMREADTIPGLVDAEEVLILDTKTYEHIGNLLWAPEFHVIESELYIFHAASPKEFFCEEAHVMKLCTGGNPMCAADWSEPRRVVRKDGSELCEAGKTISLDMTCIKLKNEYYAIWSQRQFLPVDQGAWLYIAKLDPKQPWRLITDPVVIAKPEYGWENNHVFVVEGAYALFSDERLFVTYSGALVDATYCVGLLIADPDADLLDPESWTKGNYPLLTSRSVLGEYGPGHNSYVVDDSGIIWNAYHARPGVKGPRSSGIRRVHYDIDGYPRLDLVEEKDLNRELVKVYTEVVVS